MPEPTFAEAHAANNGTGFLFPTDLQRTPITFGRLLIIGSCVAEIFYRLQPFQCEADFILANNVATLPELPPKPAAEYDLQLIQLPLRYILPEQRLWSLRYDDVAAHDDLFADCCNSISQRLEAMMRWNIQAGLLSLVTNFIVPSQNFLGRTLARYDLRNPVYFVERLNEHLAGELVHYSNTYLLDVDHVAASIGRRHVQGDAISWIVHGGLFPQLPPDDSRIEPSKGSFAYYEAKSSQLTAEVWKQVEYIVRTIRQIDQVKLVVVDLDDTLWKGTIGDHDDVSVRMIEAGAHMGFIEALAFLKKRGILLAVNSKNDEARVRSLWPKIVGDRLSLDDFAVVKINWNPKPENMQEILAVTNLLPRSVVFVDDSPRERAAMTSAYPEIRVLHGHHYYWKRILLWSAETQVAAISAVSARRTEMVRAQVNRETQKRAMSRDDFMSGLAMKIRMSEIVERSDHRFPRALELVNKTNQFNTTGERWTQEGLVTALASDVRLLSFDAEDRFSHYGLVGLVLLQRSAIVQFVMSCRVAGLEVEQAVLSGLAKSLVNNGHRVISGRLLHTDANFLCRPMFEGAGFRLNGDIWSIEAAGILPIPSHITVTIDLYLSPSFTETTS